MKRVPKNVSAKDVQITRTCQCVEEAPIFSKNTRT